MNILVDALPDAVEVDGQEHPINTDFRASLRVIMAYEDDDLTAVEKQIITLQNLYPEGMPENVSEALRMAGKFLNGGRDASEETVEGFRLYAFSKDADLIFAAFQQTHGVDLETVQMHWWKFLALFMDLGADTAFCNLVGLRKRVKSGKATKEEKQLAREMGDAFDVPELETPYEKARETEFLRLVEIGRQKRQMEKPT